MIIERYVEDPKISSFTSVAVLEIRIRPSYSPARIHRNLFITGDNSSIYGCRQFLRAM